MLSTVIILINQVYKIISNNKNRYLNKHLIFMYSFDQLHLKINKHMSFIFSSCFQILLFYIS